MEEEACELIKKGLISFVQTVLPALSSTSIEEIVTLLILAGVEKEDDIQYITENDLKDSTLKPVHIRKLILHAKSSPISKNDASSFDDDTRRSPMTNGASPVDEAEPSCSQKCPGQVYFDIFLKLL